VTFPPLFRAPQNAARGGKAPEAAAWRGGGKLSTRRFWPGSPLIYSPLSGLRRLAAVFFILSAFPLAAQHFKPFTVLRVLQTEYFEIIYPAASAGTAQKLSERVDTLYENVSAMTGIKVGRKIPVVITPETDEHNGYMNPLPYPHIVMFDTPASIEWTVFTNSIEKLFLHEMTHAVTGSTRGKTAEILYRVFGGWVYPSGMTAPWFMIEGAAVSFESLDGAGRANDPLIKQKLRQDILENKFKTPFQAEGVWDLPPGGNTYYYYGGLFSAYLQRKYGMEKYGELWRKMGGGFNESIFFYKSGFYDIFNKVYGVPILDCWDDFKESLAVSNVDENGSGVIYDGKTLIKDVAGGGGKIFFIDSIAAKVIEYDPSTKKTRTAASIDRTAYALDVSEDGGRILVSGYQRFGAVAGQFSRAVVVEYSVSTGFRTGREWRGLYNARYFRDGVVALKSDTHIANLVYRSGGGNEEILLRGSETLLFSNPSPLDGDWIAFTSAKSGVRELSLFNYKTRSVYALRGGLESDEDPWRYMRGLRFSGGRLYFSYNDDDRMYKLASVSVDLGNSVDLGSAAGGPDAESISASGRFSGRDFSGGVFYPVQSGGAIYYGAAFSVWDKVLMFPETVQEFENAAPPVPLKMIPWPAGLGVTEKPPGPPVENAKLYNPLKYFNPFNLWIPFPVVNPFTSQILANDLEALGKSGNFDSISLDGAGIFSYISDPLDQNLILLGAGYDFRRNFAPLGITWINYNFMLPITVNFSDLVMTDKSYTPRKTSAGVNASYRLPLGNERLALTIFGSLNALWYSFDSYDPYTGQYAGDSPYIWPVRQEVYYTQAGLRISSLMTNSWERLGNGVSEQLYVRNMLEEGYYPRFENIITASLENAHGLQPVPVVRDFAFRGSLYGVYDREGVDVAGNSAYFTAAFSGIALSEYAVSTAVYPYLWLVGGEFEFSPVSFEIQKNLSHLYFNRIFASLGYRWAYMDGASDPYRGSPHTSGGRLLHSLIFKLTPSISIVPVTVLPLKMTFSLLCSLKLSALENTSPADDWYLGWTFSLSY
jgi:hypothetical protein